MKLYGDMSVNKLNINSRFEAALKVNFRGDLQFIVHPGRNLLFIFHISLCVVSVLLTL